MPIANYERMALKAEDRVFNDPRIPEQTKTVLRRFLLAYDVKPARKVIFLTKVQPLLQAFDPIESALTQRDQINAFFADLRRRYALATYDTYLNVIKCFLRWLNDGDQPRSVKDLRRPKASATRRNLKPEDMHSWEDALAISEASCSLQLAAAVQTQTDCGFRPSEFIDINYGDVSVSTGLAILEIHDGKTGRRTVVAHRCVPALLKWMDAHPTKNPNDPLWVQEKSLQRTADGKLHVKPYRYATMLKQIKTIARKIGISKPIYFYNLRHSSCVLDKMDNLPVDLATERHGHSVKHFVTTYGRLSVKDVMRRYHSHYGTADTEPIKQIEHQTCPVCQALNSEKQDWCSGCGTPLNGKGALEMAKKQGLLGQKGHDASQSELEQMRAELAASREREAEFRKEQMAMLQQMQEIRSALSSGNLNSMG